MTVRGRLTLPSNPNCLVFAAAAEDVLGRPWSEVLNVAARPLMHFHDVSGLPAAAWFGGREERVAEVTLHFVFDGPASADDLEALERATAACPVRFGRGHIERIPRAAVPALMARGGRLHQLWRARGGGHALQRLSPAPRGVRIREVPSSEASVDELLEEAAHVELRFADPSDLDAELERMRVAFARHFSQRIVEADGIVADDERAFMRTVFPDELLARLGLAEGDDRETCLAEAAERLPTALGYHDKLAMLGLFFSACYCDGALDAREVSVLREAGEALGLGRPEIVRYLSRFW